MNDRREHDRIDAEIARSENSSDPFAAAVRTTRMPMLITDPNQHDNPIIFVNDAFLTMSGYTRDEIIGCNCRFLQGPETDPAAIARVRDAIERRVPIEVELLNHKKSGEVFWNRLLISPVFDSDHALTYFFASQFDVTLERDRLVRLQRDRDALEREVERRTTDLGRSEERLRFMLRAGRFGTWTLDLAARRLVASDLCKENCGRPAGEPFSYDDLLAAVVQEDRARMQEAMRESIENRTDYDVECRVKTPGGADRWVQFRGQTFFHADGAPLSMAGVSIDISERKRGDQQRALLAGELNHRVKNSMATVQSIVHQTLRNAASLDVARTALDARLQSLSSAHDVLTREHWVGTTLAEVVDGTLKPFRAPPDARFKIGGPDVRLSPRLTLAFAMALHELATNAVKYGALSNDRGFVILSWNVVGGSSPARLWLRWEECGGPDVVTPDRKGFGTRMIERALALELGGTAQIDYRPRGVVLSVEAPLPEQASQEA